MSRFGGMLGGFYDTLAEGNDYEAANIKNKTSDQTLYDMSIAAQEKAAARPMRESAAKEEAINAAMAQMITAVRGASDPTHASSSLASIESTLPGEIGLAARKRLGLTGDLTEDQSRVNRVLEAKAFTDVGYLQKYGLQGQQIEGQLDVARLQDEGNRRNLAMKIASDFNLQTDNNAALLHRLLVSNASAQQIAQLDRSGAFARLIMQIDSNERIADTQADTSRYSVDQQGALARELNLSDNEARRIDRLTSEFGLNYRQSQALAEDYAKHRDSLIHDMNVIQRKAEMDKWINDWKTYHDRGTIAYKATWDDWTRTRDSARAYDTALATVNQQGYWSERVAALNATATMSAAEIRAKAQNNTLEGLTATAVRNSIENQLLVAAGLPPKHKLSDIEQQLVGNKLVGPRTLKILEAMGEHLVRQTPAAIQNMVSNIAAMAAREGFERDNPQAIPVASKIVSRVLPELESQAGWRMLSLPQKKKKAILEGEQYIKTLLATDASHWIKNMTELDMKNLEGYVRDTILNEISYKYGTR